MRTEAELSPDEREALKIMRSIVAAKGEDYVYPDEEKSNGTLGTCQYLRYEDGRPVGPSCIVGHYLVAIGMSYDELSAFEGSGSYHVAPYPEESPLSRALQRAQTVQDGGDPWGVALRSFEQVLFGEDVL